MYSGVDDHLSPDIAELADDDRDLIQEEPEGIRLEVKPIEKVEVEVFVDVARIGGRINMNMDEGTKSYQE